MSKVRNCPRCDQKGIIRHTGPYCVGCAKNFSKEYASCPYCKSDRTVLRFTIHNDKGKCENHYCHGCFSEFETEPKEDEDFHVRRPPAYRTPNPASLQNEWYGGYSEYGYDPWGSQGQTYNNQVSKRNRVVSSRGIKQEGQCPVCQGEVTLYSKTGGYCSVCKEHVYPYISKVHPFSMMEEI